VAGSESVIIAVIFVNARGGEIIVMVDTKGTGVSKLGEAVKQSD